MKKPKDPIRATKRGLIYDKMDPREFNNIDFRYCCEQCSHFDGPTSTCTIGYDASKYMREVQHKMYDLSGRMAMCRFIEVD